jgi:hypothetical protein
MYWMQDIIVHSKENEYMPANQAMASLVHTWSAEIPRPAMAQMPNGPMMGQRHASENFTMSPHMHANMVANANGSPHLQGGNPMAGMVGLAGPQGQAQQHMAPQMVGQLSQQGSAGTGNSSNTSPSLNNKRRRSTAPIKAEDGEMNGSQTGKKVKQSPQVNSKKLKS